jgi:hypothetical protein
VLKALPAARRVQVSEAVAIISATDFPAKWPTLLPELMQHIASSDYAVVIGVLKTANEIFKRCGHPAASTVPWMGSCADETPVAERRCGYAELHSSRSLHGEVR